MKKILLLFIAFELVMILLIITATATRVLEDLDRIEKHTRPEKVIEHHGFKQEEKP